ncbi:hypothetical protein CbuD7D7780_08020 [Coxiella burnetii]|nr:hypothetical protein CbuD7E6568_08000 [Coxiella burnetii]OYK81932.1 hypothetical protein CbuD7D7780_08020 [Coxiella burnetii]
MIFTSYPMACQCLKMMEPETVFSPKKKFLLDSAFLINIFLTLKQYNVNHDKNCNETVRII